MNQNEVIKSLLTKENVKLYKACKIKKATVNIMPTYVQVKLFLDKEIDRYVPNINADGVQEGNNVLGKTTVAFTTSFALAGVLLECPEAAFATNKLVESPKGFEVILSGAMTDIITEDIVADPDNIVDYVNPFSNVGEARLFDHNTTICHPVNISFSPFGLRMLEKIAENLIG